MAVVEPSLVAPRRPVSDASARRDASERSIDEAMERYADGHAEAFAELHARLFPRLRAFLLRIGVSGASVDDLVQETFFRLHKSRAVFARGGAVIPWAFAIARNVKIDAQRAARRSGAVSANTIADHDLPKEPAAGAEADVESAAIAAEAATRVQHVLRGLPEAQREAFVLLRYEGMSVRGAARVLGATETSVKLRAFRAYEALRAAIGDAEGFR